MAFDFGDEREPATVRDERLKRERVAAGKSRTAVTPATEPPPPVAIPEAPSHGLPLTEAPPIRPPVAPRHSGAIIGAALQELMSRPPEQVVLELPNAAGAPFCKITLQTPAVSCTEHSVMLLLDPAQCKVELTYETELVVVYRGKRTRVVYGGGQGQFPGWPFHILSFLVLPDDHEDRKS